MNFIDVWKICPEGELVNRISTPNKLPLAKSNNFARSLVYFINEYGTKDDDLLADDWVVLGDSVTNDENHCGFGKGEI